MKKPAVLIVDPIVSSKYLVDSLNAKGYEVVALQTLSYRSSYSDYTALPFQLIQSVGTVEDDIKALLSLELEYVCGFYGVEASIDYADQILASMFASYSNNPLSSKLRYDKYQMNEALKNHGMPYIQQMNLSADLPAEKLVEKTSEFFDKHCSIVIRPCCHSAASVGVYCPSTENDVVQYFHKDNFIFSSDEHKYLLQEKISGPEYFINIASYGGRHMVSAIGVHSKILVNGQFIYLYSDLIARASHLFKPIADYAIQALDALEMKNGLSHLEIMRTQQGFKIIELNPRICGVHGAINVLHKQAYGFDQLDAYLSLVKNTEIDIQASKENHRIVYVCNKQLQQSDIDSLTTCVGSFCLNDSDNNTTGSLLDASSFVLLSSEDQEKISIDTKQLVCDDTPNKKPDMTIDDIYLYFYTQMLTENKTNDEVDFLLSQAPLSSGDQLLDVPCGYGRHSIELAKRSPEVNIVGLDISDEFINEARNRTKKYQLSNCEFIKQDMRTLSSQEIYRCITCLYTSFGHFDEQENLAVMKSFYLALEFGGSVIIESINAGQVSQGVREFARIESDSIFDDFRTCAAPNYWDIKRTYLVDGEEHSCDYRIKIYTKDEMVRILNIAGFEQLTFYGDYNGEPYQQQSERMIVVAKK